MNPALVALGVEVEPDTVGVTEARRRALSHRVGARISISAVGVCVLVDVESVIRAASCVNNAK